MELCEKLLKLTKRLTEILEDVGFADVLCLASYKLTDRVKNNCVAELGEDTMEVWRRRQDAKTSLKEQQY